MFRFALSVNYGGVAKILGNGDNVIYADFSYKDNMYYVYNSFDFSNHYYGSNYDHGLYVNVCLIDISKFRKL